MNISLLLLASIAVSILTFVGGVLYTRYQRKESHQKILPSVIAAGGGYLLAISMFELLPMSIEHHRDSLHEIAGLVLLGVVTVSASHRLMARVLRFLAMVKAPVKPARFRPIGQKAHLFTPFTSTSLSRSVVTAPNHNKLHEQDHLRKHVHSDGDACCKPMLGVPIAQAAIGCVIVCSFFDGVMVTSGFQAGEKIGIGIYIGQLLHAVPEGIIAASLALASDQSSSASKRAALFVGSSFFIGSVFPFFISAKPTWVLPFSLGVALSVTLGQLLPMVSKKPSSWAWLASGVGFYSMIHTLLAR